MPNQLIHETSPYLLQHAHNPVNWYPWGLEALQKARDENKPIFLSIGYAACHWCHVMEHESFEDPSVAAVLNDHFVSIKVDREERPDLDGIYMNAVVAMTGQGGWPMSVFLTPQGEPFYGGTYFPPTRRYGIPAFKEVLNAVVQSWKNESGEIRRVAQSLTKQLDENSRWGGKGPSELRPTTLDQAAQTLLNGYDWQMGGWGQAPRFPQPMAIEFLMQQVTRDSEKISPRALEAVRHVLNIMSRGGLYDVVGGGFHRYSTDDAWLVPHFEKMLYDNGQLALAYLHGYLLTGEIAFRQVCEETLNFILREMKAPQGGFYSSLDADSEGEEGKYYIWTQAELDQILVDEQERALFYNVYPVNKQGNFEGHTILQRRADLPQLAHDLNLSEQELIDRLSAIHVRLYEVREKRVRPGTDDKVLVSWNALALRAFAEAARYLKQPVYLEAARKNAEFILSQMVVDGKLMRAWRQGQARHNAFLEDHAGLILALLALYQSDPDPRWYQSAVQLAEEMEMNFHDAAGGFFDTRHDQEGLISRPKEIQDNAVPSGNAQAALALLMLSAYDEREAWRAQAERMIATVQDLLIRHPPAFGFWLQALDFAHGPVQQIAVIGPREDPQVEQFLAHIWHIYRPRVVLALSDVSAEDGKPALLKDRSMRQDKPTVYVCEGFACNLPVNDLPALQEQLA